VDGTTERAKRALEALENDLGYKLPLTSSYRCESHNKAVGGAPGSKHLTGEAFDIFVRNHQEMSIIIQAAKKAGYRGFGIGETLLHIDLRKRNARWFY